MRKAVMMTDSTLGLGSSSRRTIKAIFSWVAAVFLAATFLMLPAQAAERRVQVEGVAPWLANIVERSLTAVSENIAPGQSNDGVQRVIEVVIDRLFTGFSAREVHVNNAMILVKMLPDVEVPHWLLDLQEPQLQEPPRSWFQSDLEKLKPRIAEIIRDLPLEALSWGDEGLRDEVVRVLSPDLAGWRPSILVVNEGEDTTMRISFTPEMPLILAVAPHFTSVSLPMVLNADLKEDVLERTSPMIGLPVAWAAQHAEELNLWVEEHLSDKRAIRRSGSVPKVKFEASQVSHVNVEVESKRYTLTAWAAVYAGTDDRSGELGLHLGRKFDLTKDIAGEFYGQGIMEMQDWSVEGRFGARVSPWGDVWLGGEWSTKDEMWWGKLSIDPRLRKPYAWLRIREDGEVNAAFGWKATEYISFELHYDDRDSGSWSLRMLGNL